MMQGSRTFFLSFFDYYFSRETCPTGPISFESTSFTAKVDSGEREIKKKKKTPNVCLPSLSQVFWLFAGWFSIHPA